MLTLTKYNIIL